MSIVTPLPQYAYYPVAYANPYFGSVMPADAVMSVPPDVVGKMAMNLKGSYIGRDLLRSGTDVGLDETFSFELDVPPHSAFIFKIK